MMDTGSLLDAMAKEVGLTIHLNRTVTKIIRSKDGGVRLSFEEDTEELCDLVVLTGAIPTLVTTNILLPTTLLEKKTFGHMQPMQFLVSLLDLPTANTTNTKLKMHTAASNLRNLEKDTFPATNTTTNTQMPALFKALEYWPDGYKDVGGVIVRRDIGYAETEPHHSHNIGGLQTFSYDGSVSNMYRSNYSTHWDSQVSWMERSGYAVSDVAVLSQLWVDSYYYHYP